MAAPQDVHVRICNQEIVKFDLEVKALIQDIRDCSGPLGALTELNTKVKEKFQQLRHRIQELEQSAKEQDKESEKQALLQEVENHKKQMLSNQTSWRKANLTCKIAIDNLEKAELLQGGELVRHRVRSSKPPATLQEKDEAFYSPKELQSWTDVGAVLPGPVRLDSTCCSGPPRRTWPRRPAASQRASWASAG
ncbi:vesicle transport protein SEC20 isoform X4 [Tenrec ecaudatus]|uniref:vesicle transport protein SEC20 isoform X4 n=1 Tax=Tenrec ecaudatus TaxID=94439 RepID=UPI003F59C650